MQKYTTGILIIALVLVGATLILSSDWFKQAVTGNAVEQGYTCGSYSYISPVSAVSSSSLNGAYVASKAIDNNNATSWLSNKTVFSWIYFDLGTKRCIDNLRVYVNALYVPATMDIQVSNDAQNWRAVSTGWAVSSGGNFVQKGIATESARYVRLYFTSGQIGSGGSGGSGATGTFYGSVGEIKFYTAQLIPVSGSGSSGVSGSGGIASAGNGTGSTTSGGNGGGNGGGSSGGSSSGGTTSGAGGSSGGSSGSGSNSEPTLQAGGESTSSSTWVIILVILIILVAIALVAAYYYNKKKQEGKPVVFDQKYPLK